ncbi:MAG: glycoside hydrolase family 108 protein [Bdellovibrionales bacterium]
MQDILDDILRREGWPTYTNDPSDRGGPTKGGITLATLAAWRGNPVTAEDVRDLGEAEARAIYESEYITKPCFDKITNDLLRAQVVDAGVLHGQSTAIKWLQAIAGVKTDGCFGPVSQGAVNAMSARDVGIKFAALRIRFIGAIVSKNYQARQSGLTQKDQSRFASGWLNRATAFLDEV